MREACFRACYILHGQKMIVQDVSLAGITDVAAHWLDTCAVDALLRHREWFPARAADYGPVFRALLEYGLTVTAEDYARGQKLRQITQALFEKAFREVDVIVCPAAPSPAMRPNTEPETRPVPAA